MPYHQSPAKPRRGAPPIVPRTAGEWLIPMGRFLIAGVVLLGCALALAIGRHAHLLAGAADRHH